MPRPWAPHRRQPGRCLPRQRHPRRQEPPPHPRRKASTAAAEAEEVAGAPRQQPRAAPVPTPKVQRRPSLEALRQARPRRRAIEHHFQAAEAEEAEAGAPRPPHQDMPRGQWRSCLGESGREERQ
eukprot:15484995-Alexandrium_andersonii.AAC.1